MRLVALHAPLLRKKKFILDEMFPAFNVSKFAIFLECENTHIIHFVFFYFLLLYFISSPNEYPSLHSTQT